MRISWQPRAIADVRAIQGYIAKSNPAAARRVYQEIKLSVRRLGQLPHMGRPGRIVDTRELIVVSTPFIVVYRVKADVVHVLAVMHSARAWPTSF